MKSNKDNSVKVGFVQKTEENTFETETIFFLDHSLEYVRFTVLLIQVRTVSNILFNGLSITSYFSRSPVVKSALVFCTKN